jgi:pentatricopeptide repeat protein
VVVYNSLIDGLRKVDRLEEAGSLLQEMQSWGCEPDAITYNTFIDELCRGGRIDDAYKLLEEMIGKDCADIVTYNTLLHGLCKAGRVDEAYKLFEEIQASSTLHCKVKPNYVTYTTLLSATQEAKLPKLTNTLKQWRHKARLY